MKGLQKERERRVGVGRASRREAGRENNEVPASSRLGRRRRGDWEGTGGEKFCARGEWGGLSESELI